MRLLASVSAFCVAGLVIAVTISLTHRPAVASTLTASHPIVADSTYQGSDFGDPIDHIGPHPTPSPSPAPVAVRKSQPAPPPAYVAPALVIESTQQRLINADRARYGLRPLTWSSCLASVARYTAAHLATPGVTFAHYGGVYSDLACRLGGQSGENIGWWSLGINDSQLNTMFMNSPDHRANILGPYRYVATAWAVAPNGAAYIAVEFS